MKHQNINVIENGIKITLNLGRQGEYNVRDIKLDMSDFQQKYGDGTATIVHYPANGSAYTVPSISGDTKDSAVLDGNNILTWTIGRLATMHDGYGVAEITWLTADGLKKSIRYDTYCRESIGDYGADRAAQQSYIDQMVELASTITDLSGEFSDAERIAAEIVDARENAVSDIEALKNEAVSAVNTAKSESIEDIGDSKESALDALNTAKQTALANIESAKQNAETDINAAILIADTHANNASQSATNASNSAASASNSADSASQSAASAQTSATNASNSAASASQFADNASSSANSAGQSATSAQTNATNASASEQSARQSAETAQDILDSVQAEGDTQINRVQSEGNTQIGRVQAKGNEILNSLPSDFTQVQNNIAALNGSLEQLIVAEDVPTECILIPNSYVDSNGQIKDYNGWSRTDFIPVTPGSTIKIKSNISSGWNFSYDANKQPIGSRWSVAVGENTKNLGTNVHYIVLSGETAGMSNTVVYLGDKAVYLNQELSLTASMTDEVYDIVDYKIADTFVDPTAYLIKKLIPDYYFAMNDVPIDKHDIGYLDNKINSVPDGYHFIFVTDTHWIRNAKQSTKLISYVRDRIGAKIVLFGGDILTAHNTDAIAFRCLCEFVFDYKNAFGSNLLLAVGNHDLNSSGPNAESRLTYSDLVPIFMQGCDSRFHYCDYYDTRIDELAISQGMTNEEKAKLKQYFRTCFWVDDVDGKTRYIIYNTGIGSLDGGSGIQQFISSDISGQYEELLILEWVYETLMSVPDGYNVIFCSHIPASIAMSGPGGSTPITSVRQAFATLIPSFKAKRVASVYINDRISNIERWCPRSMRFDFSQAPTVRTIAVMGGHWHIDTFVRFGFSSAMDQSHTSGTQSETNQQELSVLQNSGTVTEGHFRYEIPIIITQYDAYSGQSTSGIPQHAMEINTITEQCFDVVTIRPNGDIALTRIGAGNDRYVTIS